MKMLYLIYLKMTLWLVVALWLVALLDEVLKVADLCLLCTIYILDTVYYYVNRMLSRWADEFGKLDKNEEWLVFCIMICRLSLFQMIFQMLFQFELNHRESLKLESWN